MGARAISKRAVGLLLGDLAIILIAFHMAIKLRSGQTLGDFLSLSKIGFLVLLVFIYILSFYIFEFYNIRSKFRSTKFLVSMAAAFGLAYLFAILGFYVFPYKLGRGVFLISWVLTGAFVYSWRILYSTAFKLSEPRRNVLVISNGMTPEKTVTALKEDPEYRLAAVLDSEGLRKMRGGEGSPMGFWTLEEYVAKNKINDIVVTLEANSSSELERALVACRMKGTSCHTIESFYERLFEKLPVLMLNDRWFLMSGGFDKLGSRFYRTAKRAFDFIVAGLVLVVTLPFSVIVATLVSLTSRGPVFFVQERLGEGEKPFRIVKFRTMVDKAEEDGPQWAQNNDGRVTKVGKFLRKTRLDEIPQLINVFKGDMSLIGPRPERAFFVSQLTESVPFYSLRFFVKPGITGWAQVNFRYGSDEKDAIEKLRYELYYIKNQSLALDMRILLKTVRVVLMGVGT